jgi:hypothetical protein
MSAPLISVSRGDAVSDIRGPQGMFDGRVTRLVSVLHDLACQVTMCDNLVWCLGYRRVWDQVSPHTSLT